MSTKFLQYIYNNIVKTNNALISYKYAMNLISRILHLYLCGENIAASNTIHNILILPP